MLGHLGQSGLQTGQCPKFAGPLGSVVAHQRGRHSRIPIAKAASTMQRSLSKRMKEVYVDTGADEDLDKEYGDNVGGPPKNRRAGMGHCTRIAIN